jgi:hypothetical protein
MNPQLFFGLSPSLKHRFAPAYASPQRSLLTNFMNQFINFTLSEPAREALPYPPDNRERIMAILLLARCSGQP